jgi:hypothetical protein
MGSFLWRDFNYKEKGRGSQPFGTSAAIFSHLVVGKEFAAVKRLCRRMRAKYGLWDQSIFVIRWEKSRIISLIR